MHSIRPNKHNEHKILIVLIFYRKIHMDSLQGQLESGSCVVIFH